MSLTPFADRTSFHLAEVAIDFEDGSDLQILLKDLGLANLHETARRVKPHFLYEPRREIEMYREILTRERLGTAAYYGAVVRPDDGLFWLFLEKIQGVRLSLATDRSAWRQAARWLARFHCRFSGRCDELLRSAPLLQHDAAFYRLWAGRVERFQSGRLDRFDWASLVETHDRAVDRLCRLPPTLIHGEFYPSNILVETGPEGGRIRPVDWEMAAVGPGLIDLAALTSGGWADRERTDMAAAYHDTMLDEGRPGPSFDDLLGALDDCRLHLAFQWLGWAHDWSPPRENAQDWLGEALALAGKIRGR